MCLGLILFLFGAPLFGQTDLTFGQTPKNSTQAYDFDNGISAVYSLAVKHRGEETEFFITFSAGGSGNPENRRLISPGQGILPYQLYGSSSGGNVLKDLSSNPAENEVLSGVFAASSKWQTGETQYVFTVPPDYFLPSEQYEDSVVISLYRGTLEQYTLMDTVTQNFLVSLEEVMELAVVPSNYPFGTGLNNLTLDFGILIPGEVMGGDIVVRSNAGYTLSLKSKNRGIMKNLDRSDKSEVPYSFLLNGGRIELNSNKAVDVLVDQPSTVISGARFPFDVVIGDYGMATEGSYEDVITLTVESK